ncbi:Bifunctional arginine demethylase and lysyl-hydroxylase JMJD6, partial [Trichinella pseudospiralis]
MAMVNPAFRYKIVKKRTKKFTRHQCDRYRKLKPNWRKPKGIDNRVRRKFKGQRRMPNIGYGSRRVTKHMLPNGFRKVLIHNARELDMLLMQNRFYCAEIAHSVSAKKRKDILNMEKKLHKRINEIRAKVRSDIYFQSCLFLNGCHYDGLQCSVEEFVLRYESKSCTVLITNLQWETLRKYCNQFFKCGEDYDSYSVNIKIFFLHILKDKTMVVFYTYLIALLLKIYLKKERNFISMYFFKDDLFCYASERRPPSHRWFGMGPARFGTAIYIDPLGTHAWNAVISGQRCWCLFPPDTPESLVKLKPGEGCEHRSEAIIWIIFVEVLQKLGETIFLPDGWWNVVLNLDLTVAITIKITTVQLVTIYQSHAIIEIAIDIINRIVAQDVSI